jgi:hypothetical protein
MEVCKDREFICKGSWGIWAGDAGGDAGLSRELGSKKAGSGTALSPSSYETIFLSAYSSNYLPFRYTCNFLF